MPMVVISRRLKSSLEAEVDIVLPDIPETKLTELLKREGRFHPPLMTVLYPYLWNSVETFLKTLFITSDAIVTDEGSFGTSSPEWVYSDTITIPGKPCLCKLGEAVSHQSVIGVDDDLAVRVRPATMQKCPRCWTFTKPITSTLCERCTEVVPL